MGTGTLDLTRVEEERRRFEEERRSEDEDPSAVAERIVEEVLAAEAALEESLRREQIEEADGATSERTPRRHLVWLGVEDPLVLVPGPVYAPGDRPFVPTRDGDRLELLVDDAIGTLRAQPHTIGGALRSAADSPAMPATRWVMFGLLWMAAFAGLVPFAFATIGNALEVEVDIFGEAEGEPAIEQIQPEGADETENPSVQDEG